MTTPDPLPTVALFDALDDSQWAPHQIGLVIVDHGSHRADSNQALVNIADHFASKYELNNVEPAHMELAEPSIKMAFEKCVARGARFVIVLPFFSTSRTTLGRRYSVADIRRRIWFSRHPISGHGSFRNQHMDVGADGKSNQGLPAPREG